MRGKWLFGNIIITTIETTIKEDITIQRVGVGEINVGILITDAGAKKTNGIHAMIRLKMTDTKRIMILLTAIRCILALDERARDPLRLRLIKSVLFEAVQECRRDLSFEDAPGPAALIRAIEDEVAGKAEEIIL